jgi:hypothetical protein
MSSPRYVFLLENSTLLTIYLYCIQDGSRHLHYHHNTWPRYVRMPQRWLTHHIQLLIKKNYWQHNNNNRDDDEPQLVTSPTGHKGCTSPLSLNSVNCAPGCATTPTSTSRTMPTTIMVLSPQNGNVKWGYYITCEFKVQGYEDDGTAMREIHKFLHKYDSVLLSTSRISTRTSSFCGNMPIATYSFYRPI